MLALEKGGSKWHPLQTAGCGALSSPQSLRPASGPVRPAWPWPPRPGRHMRRPRRRRQRRRHRRHRLPRRRRIIARTQGEIRDSGANLVIIPARRSAPGPKYAPAAPGNGDTPPHARRLPAHRPPVGCQRGEGSRLARPVSDHGTGCRGSIASRCVAGSQSGSSPPGAPRQAGEISRRARRPSDGSRSNLGGYRVIGASGQESGGSRNSWVRDSRTRKMPC